MRRVAIHVPSRLSSSTPQRPLALIIHPLFSSSSTSPALPTLFVDSPPSFFLLLLNFDCFSSLHLVSPFLLPSVVEASQSPPPSGARQPVVESTHHMHPRPTPVAGPSYTSRRGANSSHSAAKATAELLLRPSSWPRISSASDRLASSQIRIRHPGKAIAASPAMAGILKPRGRRLILDLD